MSARQFSPFPQEPEESRGPRTLAEVEALVQEAGAISKGEETTDEWREPDNLGEQLLAVPVFNPELLPESLRPMVEDIADRMQVPIDFPAIVSVCTIAGLCGRRALIQPKERDGSWLVVPNLWGAIVAQPGMMKSPVIASVTREARALETEWRAENAASMQQYGAALELAKLDRAVWMDNYKRAARKQQTIPERPASELIKPPEKRLIAVDATFESLHQLLAENPQGLFVLRDELSGWLASLERQGRESERAFYLESWNGDSGFTIDRIGRGSIHVEHCCVSLFGGIQPARLRSYLADALRDGPTNDGLIQRFQLLVWPDMKKDWSYQDRAPDADAMNATAAAYRRIAEMDDSQPLHLRFSNDAQGLFVDWLTGLEAHLRADDISPPMQAHLAKYRKLMPALALLFSLADGSLEAVELRHAEQAVAWCAYLKRHALRVYGSRATPEQLAAISLGTRLLNGWRQAEKSFSIRDVYQNDWSGLRTPSEVRAAVRVLEHAGWVKRKNLAAEPGRPTEIYSINPMLRGSDVGRSGS
jgi:putative DNA primase/helicase